jgi:hypothetical protein
MPIALRAAVVMLHRCYQAKKIPLIISYKRIVSRPIPKKQSIRATRGHRAAAEDHSLFIAAGDKRKEKTFYKSENTVDMTFLRDILENLACPHKVRPVFPPDG